MSIFFHASSNDVSWQGLTSTMDLNPYVLKMVMVVCIQLKNPIVEIFRNQPDKKLELNCTLL